MIKYKRDYRHKIRQMRQTSPKEYWKYKNSINRKNDDPNVNIDAFYEFFKDLNEDVSEYADEPESDFPEFSEETYLNREISTNEISKAVRDLKNNKSSGLDKISKKYIKSTASLFLPIYHKLFSVVFDTSLLPDAWLFGVIIPIYKNKGSMEEPNNYRPITIQAVWANFSQPF